jgi:endoglucanase
LALTKRSFDIAGTNFLIRANAFQECGWSPTWTLTEDFALGMELKKRKWQCRYMREFLAVGEAPHQVRNCFQQKSRWCKVRQLSSLTCCALLVILTPPLQLGRCSDVMLNFHGRIQQRLTSPTVRFLLQGHFQVLFDREHCPIFQGDLSWLQRIMYLQGVWSYIVGSLCTPTFIIVPIVTIWAGVFPIVLNFWAAVGLTIYYLATSFVRPLLLIHHHPALHVLLAAHRNKASRQEAARPPGASEQVLCPLQVLYYVRNRKHIGPLWFSNIANQIMWFTYVKALWRGLVSAFGTKISFKTTLKGAGR